MGPELTRQRQRVYLLRPKSCPQQKHLHPGGHGPLGKLHLPHIRSGKINAPILRQVNNPVAVHVPLQPKSRHHRGLLRWQQTARRINNPKGKQRCRQLQQTCAADTPDRTGRDSFNKQVSAFRPGMAHGPRAVGHAAGNARPFKGGPAGYGAAQKAIPSAQRHFAVGPHIQEQMLAGAVSQTAGGQSGSDVAAHIARHTRSVEHRSSRQPVTFFLRKQGEGHERSAANGRGTEAPENMLHHRVSGKGNSLHLRPLDGALA